MTRYEPDTNIRRLYEEELTETFTVGKYDAVVVAKGYFAGVALLPRECDNHQLQRKDVVGGYIVACDTCYQISSMAISESIE